MVCPGFDIDSVGPLFLGAPGVNDAAGFAPGVGDVAATFYAFSAASSATLVAASL